MSGCTTPGCGQSFMHDGRCTRTYTEAEAVGIVAEFFGSLSADKWEALHVLGFKLPPQEQGAYLYIGLDRARKTLMHLQKVKEVTPYPDVRRPEEKE